MAANFPNSPNTNDTFTSGGVTFTWNGSVWKQPASPGVKGTKGDKGEKGEKGQKGEKGEKGQKGQKGEVGTGGTKGEKGEKGQKGDKGEKGQKGDKGEKGQKGDKGQKGEVGATGTGTGTADRIFENDTSVECVDTGTGVVEVKVDGTEVITVNANTTTFNDDVKLTGANYDAIWNKSDNELEFRDNAKLGFGYNGSGSSSDLTISHTNSLSSQNDSDGNSILDGGDWASFIEENGTGPLIFKTNGGPGTGAYQFYDAGWRPILKLFSGSSARAALYYAGSEKLITDAGGISITGGIKDKDGDLGTSGQVLSSTGTELNWVAATSGQKGEKGEKGQKGLKGEDNSTKGQKGEASTVKGEKGAPGADNSTKGQKGQKGEVGNTTKGQKGEPSTVSGAKGDKGQKGQDGSAGSTGIPSGFIGLWSGAANAIPSGWYLCDGNNNTPDLRDKFIIGAGNSYAVDATGGSKDATLVSHSHTINNHTHSFSGSSSHSHTVNSHTHSFSGSGSSSHTHNIFSTDIDDHNDSTRRIANDRNDRTGYYPSNRDFSVDSATVSISVSGTTGGSSPGTNSQTVSISGNTGNPSNTGTNAQGSSATNANLPPYYALCYIMKS